MISLQAVPSFQEEPIQLLKLLRRSLVSAGLKENLSLLLLHHSCYKSSENKIKIQLNAQEMCRDKLISLGIPINRVPTSEQFVVK